MFYILPWDVLYLFAFHRYRRTFCTCKVYQLFFSSSFLSFCKHGEKSRSCGLSYEKQGSGKVLGPRRMSKSGGKLENTHLLLLIADGNCGSITQESATGLRATFSVLINSYTKWFLFLYLHSGRLTWQIWMTWLTWNWKKNPGLTYYKFIPHVGEFSTFL